MKYCTKCGKQLDDDAVFCSACGAATITKALTTADAPFTQTPDKAPSVQPAETSAIKIVAKVFMLISCICSGIWLFPLAWTIPMTAVYWSKLKNHQPVGVGFKVCTLLFVSLIAGILMLCDNTN